MTILYDRGIKMRMFASRIDRDIFQFNNLDLVICEFPRQRVSLESCNIEIAPRGKHVHCLTHQHDEQDTAF